jgi:hypothetical protein
MRQCARQRIMHDVARHARTLAVRATARGIDTSGKYAYHKRLLVGIQLNLWEGK